MNSGSLTKLIALVAAAVCAAYFVFTHMGYFGNIDFLGALLLLQVLAAALWKYEQVFFPVLLSSFLWAGMNVPLQGVWTAARWAVLAVGAVGGFAIWMKRPPERFRFFHLVAALCVCAAIVSAMVSSIPGLALSKAGSLLLLFLYGAAGVRLAVVGREAQFFCGLLLGCEIVAYLSAVCYLVLGAHVFGNQNSLGAAMSIAVLPILLWGWYTTEPGPVRSRRLVALMLAAYLVYFSMSRAAMLAAGLVGLVLCLSLRQYKLLLRASALVLFLITITGVVAPAELGQSITDLQEAVLYKGHKEEGLLGSRQTPWDETVAEIKKHPFFGSGFGTSPTEENANRAFGRYSSTSETNREHGSSYMAIAEWMGLLGLLPFTLLIALVAFQVWKVMGWLRRMQNPRHYSVPLAMVLLAGLAHATFEDWLFAVGSYTCVFFWSLAFVLVDLVPVTAAVRQRSTCFDYARLGEGLHVPMRGR